MQPNTSISPPLLAISTLVPLQVPMVAILALYLLILIHLKKNENQRRALGLTRPAPDGRRDIQCHQNEKLLLNERRALRLMGENGMTSE